MLTCTSKLIVSFWQHKYSEKIACKLNYTAVENILLLYFGDLSGLSAALNTRDCWQAGTPIDASPYMMDSRCLQLCLHTQSRLAQPGYNPNDVPFTHEPKHRWFWCDRRTIMCITEWITLLYTPHLLCCNNKDQIENSQPANLYHNYTGTPK